MMDTYSFDIDSEYVFPDIVLPGQQAFTSRWGGRILNGELALIAAVLQKGIDDAILGASAGSGTGSAPRRERVRNEALFWLKSDARYLFSFAWCCDALGVDAGWARVAALKMVEFRAGRRVGAFSGANPQPSPSEWRKRGKSALRRGNGQFGVWSEKYFPCGHLRSEQNIYRFRRGEQTYAECKACRQARSREYQRRQLGVGRGAGAV